MRKQVFGRKLKRDANERTALFHGLMDDLVLKEKITTTEEKAKAIKSQIEKLVTKAKTKGETAKHLLQPYVSVAAVKKLMNDLAKRFSSRTGGYTRIIKLGKRFGDNAKMAMIEWVEKPSAIVMPKASVIASEAKQSSPKKTAPKKTAKAKPIRQAQGKKETK